jgi:two-component system, OmpR family, phosphate regulon sensor histidine kinase PhoR
MPRKRLLWQLFPSYLLITLISLLAVTWYASRSWRQFYLGQTAGDLESRARLVESQIRSKLPAAGPELDRLCKELGRLTATRFTVILPSGVVQGDTDEDPARMDNHGDRPEIQAAIKGGVGVSTRFSFTLGHDMMYVAVPVTGPDRVIGVVRAALPMAAIAQALRALYFRIALGGMGIVLIMALLSLLISRRITQPLEDLKRGARRFAQGDLGRKLPVPASEELGSLAEAMNHMAGQLEDRIRTLIRQGQEQEAILAGMVEGVMALDTEGCLLTINRAGAEMLGVDPAAVQHLGFQEVVRNSELRWFINRLRSAREPIEGEVTLKEAGPRVLQVHGTSLRDAAGMVIGALVVLHDITHLRRLETARRDFAANVSHELKTPLTSLKGFVETLLAGALKEPENAAKFLRIIAQQTDRLNEIIDDLLSLSRIEQEAERHQIDLTRGNLKEVLQAARQVCAPKASAKNINIEVTCPDTLRTNFNAPLLEQALVNLIDNAIKFSAPDSAVWVDAQPAGGEIVIRVRDQGGGIAPEHLDRIFERFYRVDAGRSRKEGGTGLGLAIVKHIAQAHGGRVTVESASGKGSTFVIIIPHH